MAAKEKIHKIIASYLNVDASVSPEKVKAFLQLLDDAYKKKYSEDEFMDLLDRKNVQQSNLADLVREIFHTGKEKDIILVAKMLGARSNLAAGYKLLPKTWLSRQFDYSELENKLEERWWHLFKDQEWINKHKEVKYVDIK